MTSLHSLTLTLTLCISRKRRQKPVHVRLRQGTGSLNKEVREEAGGIERVFPVNLAWICLVELYLHNDGPDVDAQIQDDNGI